MAAITDIEVNQIDIHETDLIDLSDSSPINSNSSDGTLDSTEVSRNLLDTEIPEFEETLQNFNQFPIECNHSRSSSLDVEDILISIEDDNEIRNNIRIVPLPVKRSYSEIVFDTRETLSTENLTRSWSCDNIEAMEVLNNLDEVLNALLDESDNILNISKENKDFLPEKEIEECLLELDNYLTTLDPEDYVEIQSELFDSSDNPCNTEINKNKVPNDVITASVHVDKNYDKKFLARKSQSARCNRVGKILLQGTPYTIGSSRKRRSKLQDSIVCHDCISGTAESRHERGVNQERRLHAAVDCCTGTVVVEPSRTSNGSLDVSGNLSTDMDDANKGNTTVASWLRSSMRRLQHFRLPNALPLESSVDVPSAPITNLPVERPVSAPSRLPPTESERSRSRLRSRLPVGVEVSLQPNGGRARSSSASSRSQPLRSLSSSESSLDSTDSTTNGTTVTPPVRNTQEPTATNNSRRSCERPRQNDMPEAESPIGQWPHSLSSMMACLGCTLGLFNISRFAILTVHFGANFIFQFFFLSMVFGLPLFSLQICLGQQLGAGVIDMWRISPLFQGVGVSLLLSQVLIGLYSIIGVSWMFVFFRDSFITKMDKYRWAEPFMYYRDKFQVPGNGTFKLSETIPDYFSGVVLQRRHLTSGTSYGTIKFQLAFNLAVVWMIVFVSLSKGLRSYGKVIYVFTLLPVFATFVLCAKILGMMPPEFVNIIFPETSWSEFFLNPKSWLAAAQETFLTWGLLGAALMQIASHNKHKQLLQRDSSLVAVITFTILLLVAFLANTCVQILRAYGYSYLPDSFERISSYTFLRLNNNPLPPSLGNTPVRYMFHNSLIMGERVDRPGSDRTSESGYQVLRLATELIPATFAVLGSEQISPFWAVLFYFIIILFGIAQQLAIWHCVITGIIAIKAKVLKSWETTITFFSCACGFLIGLPMATELGIYFAYFMDYTIGGIWWLLIIVLLQIIAVFMVRGRPYSGDTVVTALFNSNNHPCILSWAPALLSFTWNVILPVSLMVLCIATFKNGNFREMFVWHHAPIAEYWPLWSRQIGSLLQLLPIICVPLVAVIQSYRYLNNGPNDILERIQLLYRPPIGDHMDSFAIQEAAASVNNNNVNTSINLGAEDPPPKYTPPPSYTTATGARIAKFFRQSIRRSVRRIANVLGETSNSDRHRSAISQNHQPPPPDYDAVLVEMNQSSCTTIDTTVSMIDSNTPTTPVRDIRLSTLERLRNLQPSPGHSAITAAEVASILRSSFRRSTVRRDRQTNTFVDNSMASLSAENLVHSAVPIGETSLDLGHFPPLVGHENKNGTDNLSSVI